MIQLLLLPFRIIWAFISLIFNLTGRLLGVSLGLVLMIIGLILMVTVVGAFIGVPLAVIGLLLAIKSLFD